MTAARPDPPIAVRGWRGLWHRLRRAEHAHDVRREVAEQLYQAVVKQARRPVWYRELGVRDTPEGRFEMIALHSALVLRRLRDAGMPGQALGQQLFDVMFADLDGSLRELGVSDLSVGAYVKRLAGNFYARLAALDQGLAGGIGRSDEADGSLYAMLRTNAYHAASPSDEQVAALASWLVAQDRALASEETDALCHGTIAWVDPVVCS